MASNYGDGDREFAVPVEHLPDWSVVKEGGETEADKLSAMLDTTCVVTPVSKPERLIRKRRYVTSAEPEPRARLTPETEKCNKFAEGVSSHPSIVKKIMSYLPDNDLWSSGSASKKWLEWSCSVRRGRNGNKPFLLLWRSTTSEASNLEFSLEMHLRQALLIPEKPDPKVAPIEFLFLFGTPQMVEPDLRNVDESSSASVQKTGLGLTSLNAICIAYGVNAVYLISDHIIFTSPSLTSKHFVENANENALQTLCIPASTNMSVRPFSIRPGLSYEELQVELGNTFQPPFGKDLKAIVILQYQMDDEVRDLLCNRIKHLNPNMNLESPIQIVGGMIDVFGSHYSTSQPSCSGITVNGNSNVRAFVIGIKASEFKEYQFKQMIQFLDTAPHRFVLLIYKRSCSLPVQLIKSYFHDIPFVGVGAECTSFQGSEFLNDQQFGTAFVNFDYQSYDMIFLLVAYF